MLEWCGEETTNMNHHNSCHSEAIVTTPDGVFKRTTCTKKLVYKDEEIKRIIAD